MGYTLIWEPRGVVKRFFGHVTGQQLYKAGLDTEGDARFDDYRYVINDFLECTEFSVPYEIVEEIAAVDGAAAIVNPNIRIAVVAKLPEILAAVTQYSASSMHPYATRVFSTLADARAWLASD
jgi:hypothetical protein